jgi:prolyl-tRNA editing enzyme YbaK/EbsC (Cys-tRNA(Pro) deacylase)
VVDLPRGSSRISSFLKENSVAARVVILDDSTRTSKMAAEALGCSVAQIAKSIVFVNGEAVVVVISGDMRIDLKKLSRLLGENVKIANAEEVHKSTGYVIGGVPPFPHEEGVRVILDSSLQRFDEVWAAAGTPHSVMKLSIGALMQILGDGFVDVAQ